MYASRMYKNYENENVRPRQTSVVDIGGTSATVE